MKEEDLQSYFNKFGQVTGVSIMYDHEKGNGKHRGFAFVDFVDSDHVDKIVCE